MNLDDLSKKLGAEIASVKELADKYLKTAKEYTEGKKKLTEEQEKELKKQKEAYEKEKKALDEFHAALNVEINKQLAEQLIALQQDDKLSKEELTEKEAHYTKLLELRKNYAADIEKTNATITKADAVLDPQKADADKKNKAKADKEDADKKYQEKYNKIAKQTAEYTQTLSSSMTTVLGESTKFIDSQIAKYKEQMAELDKKIANTKREAEDAKKETQKALDAAKAKEMEGLDEDEKKTKTAELAELEEFYTRQAELEDINKEREGLNMEDRAKLSDEEIARFDALKESHADYATSLETKSNADKEANKKVKDLEDEKAKYQDKIDKAEKKKKKIEFSKQIITASTNIAEGVTKALAMGPIVGPIMAGILGAAGAVQLALMMSNKNKFEDGGLLSGKRHSQGGMPILGSNIEVEGGEYVVNRQSTGKNLGLLGYINSQRRELGANDLNNYFSESPTSLRSMFQNELAHAGEVPQMEPQVSVNNAQLLEAIQGINFSPRVSVTDINTVHDNMVKVDEWTGL